MTTEEQDVLDHFTQQGYLHFRTGSREICDPPVLTTDVDWVVLIEDDPIKIKVSALMMLTGLARLVLEKEKEIARLKGLAWIAYHEFNAINARSGGPLDHYGMVTVTHEYWQAITNLFAKAAGETTPWPTENAKVIFEEINRQAMKETSDE